MTSSNSSDTNTNSTTNTTTNKLTQPVYRLRSLAKSLSKSKQLPLNQALDQVAQQQGFSHWAALMAAAKDLLPQDLDALAHYLNPGDLALVAARPQLGKTRLAVKMMLDLAQANTSSAYAFSLDFTQGQMQACVNSMATSDESLDVSIDCSDEICAQYIESQLAAKLRAGDIVLIDYLQRLDEKRSLPPLQDQVEQLKQLAQTHQAIVIFICQLDRHHQALMPQLTDIRLPNPLDLNLFNKVMILSEGNLATERSVHLLHPQVTSFGFEAKTLMGG